MRQVLQERKADHKIRKAAEQAQKNNNKSTTADSDQLTSDLNKQSFCRSTNY